MLITLGAITPRMRNTSRVNACTWVRTSGVHTVPARPATTQTSGFRMPNCASISPSIRTAGSPAGAIWTGAFRSGHRIQIAAAASAVTDARSSAAIRRRRGEWAAETTAAAKTGGWSAEREVISFAEPDQRVHGEEGRVVHDAIVGRVVSDRAAGTGPPWRGRRESSRRAHRGAAGRDVASCRRRPL